VSVVDCVADDFGGCGTAVDFVAIDFEVIRKVGRFYGRTGGLEVFVL
jgi:hypothetical protein